MIGQLQIRSAGYGGADDLAWALGLYRRTLLEGGVRRWFGQLVGRCHSLRSLREAARSQGRERGLQAVSIAQIVGSEDRAGDFDATFTPTQEHSRARWLSVAAARRKGVALPPVQLVRADDGYYVRDGHHRISVARALGEEFIEAEIL
jgi:hypothetical protein